MRTIRRLAGTCWPLCLWLLAQMPLSAAEPTVLPPLRVIKFLNPDRMVSPEVPEKDKPAVVVGVSIAPGGAMLAAAGDDHQVGLYNPQTGERMRFLRGHTDWVRTVQFAPKGGVLATAGNDRQIRFWNPGSGEELLSLPRHANAIAGLTFHPQGEVVAALGFEDRLKLYDANSGNMVRELSCASADNRAVTFSPDGRQLVAGGRQGKIRVWKSDDWSVQFALEGHRRRVRAVAFSPDSALLASAGDDRTIRLWNAATGELATEIPLPAAKAFSLVFISNDRLACGGSDNLVHIFDVNGGEVVSRLDGHTGSVASLAYDAASMTLVSGSYDTTIGVWNLAELDRRRTTQLPTELPLR